MIRDFLCEAGNPGLVLCPGQTIVPLGYDVPFAHEDFLYRSKLRGSCQGTEQPRSFGAFDLYEAAHILIAAPRNDAEARTAARATADTILAAVKSDRTAFADLAANHSNCTTSASDGGYLGQITRGQTVAEFEAGLERMQPGEVAIVETRYGFHVVRLDRRAEGETLRFEIVRERIADYLIASVEHRAIAQYVAILAGRADIAGISLAAADTPLVQ